MPDHPASEATTSYLLSDSYLKLAAERVNDPFGVLAAEILRLRAQVKDLERTDIGPGRVPSFGDAPCNFGGINAKGAR